jgi:hypothetical protein
MLTKSLRYKRENIKIVMRRSFRQLNLAVIFKASYFLLVSLGKKLNSTNMVVEDKHYLLGAFILVTSTHSSKRFAYSGMNYVY